MSETHFHFAEQVDGAGDVEGSPVAEEALDELTAGSEASTSTEAFNHQRT